MPGPMEEATSEDLEGNLSKQDTVDVVTVRRPLKRRYDIHRRSTGVKDIGISLKCSFRDSARWDNYL